MPIRDPGSKAYTHDRSPERLREYTMPKIENGYVYPMKGNGIGTKFKDEFLKDKETVINSSD